LKPPKKVQKRYDVIEKLTSLLLFWIFLSFFFSDFTFYVFYLFWGVLL
jgi:hypothetical protein